MHSFNNNKCIFIINPNSGIAGVNSLVKQLGKYRNEFDYAIFSSIDEFRSFIKSHKDEYEIFIAAGGDGTVNSLASELIETKKILGVFPVGSGNGFAREMGFKNNLKTLATDIARKKSFEIDVLFINDAPCINVSGIGLDSIVAHKFQRFKHRGKWNYGIAAMQTLRGIRPFMTSLYVNDEKIEERLFMVSAANTRQFGNNAFLAPMARPDDGKINLVLLKPFPKILAPLLVLKMLTGTLKDSKYIKYIDSDKQIKIISEESRIHIDGEPLVIKGEINITLRKNSLRILKTGNVNPLMGN